MNAPARTGRGFVQRINDTLYNLMSGLGVSTHDKSTHAFHVVNELTRDQADAMFRSDWIARKIVKIPADDATREWRAWQAEDSQIEAIEALETQHRVQQKVRRARLLERLHGGSALVLGVAGSGSATSELKLERLSKDCLKFVHAVPRHELTAADGQLDTDLESPYYGQPKMWARQLVGGGDRVLIHPSRVIRFCGEELPDQTLSTDGWGESVLQALQDAIVAAGLVTQGTASLIQEMKTDVVGIKELSEQTSTDESTALLRRRFEITNLMKSNNRLMLVDKEDTWEQKQISFGSMPELLQMYLMIASAAGDIPTTRMLAQSPKGMSATGDSDTRNYYDKVGSEQRNDITPAIGPLDEILIISALGTRDKNVYYDWNPLWQMSEPEKADVAVKKSVVMAADVAAMLVPTDALAEGRKNQLVEDGTYPGLENALEESDGEVVDPAMERELAAQEEQAQAGHERSLETQEIGHKQAKEIIKLKPKPGAKKKAFGRDFNPNHDPSTGEFSSTGWVSGRGLTPRDKVVAAEVSTAGAAGAIGAAALGDPTLGAAVAAGTLTALGGIYLHRRYFADQAAARAAARPGQRVVRMRVSAADAEKLLGSD